MHVQMQHKHESQSLESEPARKRPAPFTQVTQPRNCNSDAGEESDLEYDGPDYDG